METLPKSGILPMAVGVCTRQNPRDVIKHNIILGDRARNVHNFSSPLSAGLVRLMRRSRIRPQPPSGGRWNLTPTRHKETHHARSDRKTPHPMPLPRRTGPAVSAGRAGKPGILPVIPADVATGTASASSERRSRAFRHPRGERLNVRAGKVLLPSPQAADPAAHPSRCASLHHGLVPSDTCSRQQPPISPRPPANARQNPR